MIPEQQETFFFCLFLSFHLFIEVIFTPSQGAQTRDPEIKGGTFC